MRTIKEIIGDEKLIDFLIKCRIDFKLFCEKVLGLEITNFHLEWFYTIQNNERVSILAPTGFGKTTILGVAYPLWIIFTYTNKQVLIVSKSLPQSTRVLALIREAIENNELLSELKPKNATETWSKQAITTTTRCKIICRPYSINIKGEHVDYILMDEASSYQDPDIYFDYIIPRAVAKEGRIALISTPESVTDLMSMVRSREIKYVHKIYPAIINGESIWKEKFPIKRLNELKKELGEQFFEKNYMCNPKAEGEKALYSLKSILKGFDYNRKFSSENEGGKVFIACDFAVASGPTADYDAYLVIEKLDTLYLIKHIEIHKGLASDAKIRRISQLFELFKPIRIVIDESNIGGILLNELRSAGLPIVPQEFHSKARNTLLMVLKNVLDGAKVIFPRSKDDPQALKLTDTLVEQLIGFKESKSPATGSTQYLSTAEHDDIAMALAMAVKEASRQKSASIYAASAS